MGTPTPEQNPEELPIVPYVMKTREEIRKLAMDISDGLVFGSWDIPFNPIGIYEDSSPEQIKRANDEAAERHAHQVRMCFLTIALGGVGFTHEQMIADPRFPKNLATPVHFYEYLSEAGPRSINGYPCFFSHRCLIGKDVKKVLKLSAKFSRAKQAMVEGL